MDATQAFVWQLEFSIAKPQYDREVAQMPKEGGLRALRVKDRYHGGAPWAVGDVEEIWFDETDQLGAADTSVRDRRFHQLSPEARLFYIVESRAMGGHYYLVMYHT